MGSDSTNDLRGDEEQTADHIVLECPKHLPPNGAYDLAVFDDETINWLLHTYAEV